MMDRKELMSIWREVTDGLSALVAGSVIERFANRVAGLESARFWRPISGADTTPVFSDGRHRYSKRFAVTIGRLACSGNPVWAV